MKNPSTSYEAWLAKADNDLLTIHNNLQAEVTPWDTVCFHAQQAAEKILKAYLVYNGKTPEYTHDLLLILTECQEIDTSLTDLSAECEALTPHGTGTRYPGSIDANMPDEEEGRAMAQAAHRVHNRILELLPT